jgi:hypothetical protein
VVLAAAVVIVQVLPLAAVDEYGDRLITACTQGLRQGACVLADEATVERASSVVAEVRWEDDKFRVAVIRLRRPQAAAGEWTSGKVAFDEDDSVPDRWTTAGFTIATLAGDLTSRAEQAAPDAAREEPPRAAPPNLSNAPAAPGTVGARPEADRAPSDRRSTATTARMTAGFTVGQAMREQPPRVGPWASVAYAPFDLPVGLRLRGALTWAERAGVEARWSTLAAGVEVHLPVVEERAALFFALDGGPSVLRATAARAQARVTAAFSLFAGGDVSLAGPFSLIGAAEASAGPTTTLNVATGSISDRRFKFGGVLGVSAKL